MKEVFNFEKNKKIENKEADENVALIELSEYFKNINKDKRLDDNTIDFICEKIKKINNLSRLQQIENFFTDFSPMDFSDLYDVKYKNTTIEEPVFKENLNAPASLSESFGKEIKKIETPYVEFKDKSIKNIIISLYSQMMRTDTGIEVIKEKIIEREFPHGFERETGSDEEIFNDQYEVVRLLVLNQLKNLHPEEHNKLMNYFLSHISEDRKKVFPERYTEEMSDDPIAEWDDDLEEDEIDKAVKLDFKYDEFTKSFFDEEIISGLTDYVFDNLKNNVKTEDIPLLIDYTKDEYAKFHVYDLIECINKIDDSPAVSSEIFKVMNDNKSDMMRKQILSKILITLELGKISLNKEGLDYLNKKFDLGVDNGKFDFAQRLTADGDVGLFKDEKLGKYVNIKEGLMKKDEIVKIQAKEFVYDTLFIGSEDETPKERKKRQEILKQFKENYYKFYDDDFFKQTGVRFNNLSFREQAWFLEYTKNNPDKNDQILNFTKKYHEAGLNTFLVMEYGEENIDKLLTLGEKGNESENDFLFRQFAEIVNQAESIDQRVNQLMTEVGNQDFFDKKIFENLIRQGKNYLLAAADIKEKGEGVIHFDGQFIEARDISTIMTLMEKIKKEMIIFLQTVNDWETLKNHGMPIIDKYLFDSKNIEKIKNTEINVFIDGSDDFKQEWHERLSEEKNINIQEDFNYLLYLKDKKKNSLPDVLLNEIDGGTSYRVQIVNMNNSILKQKELNTPNKKEIDRINNLIKVQPITIGVSKDNFSEYSVVRKQGDYSKILNTLYDPHNNETPERHKLYHMQDYIINNSFGAYNSVYLLRDAVYNKKNKPDIQFDQANLKAYEVETFTKQEHDYEINRSNPDTLKLIEEKTADTTEALRHLFQRIDENDYQSVLDLGTGEGRIGIPLAMKGIKVLGVDQVEKELASIKQRVVKEVGQTNERGYSWRHLQKLIEQETVKESELIFDEQQVLENYQTKQGNFFELDKVLPEKDEKFDMVTFTWHTFCETGTIDNQRDVLVDVYDRLNPGGMVYIEIPDRTVGAYKYALNENIKHHPNEPVGVSRDSTCLRPGVACVYDEKATPRFFPGRDELRNLLRVIGYTDVELDTYLITSHDKDGKEYLEVKELVVTAKKPKEQATVKEMSVKKKKTKVLATKKKKGLPRKAA